MRENERKKKKNMFFPGSPVVENLPCNVGDTGFISGGRKLKSTYLRTVSLCATTRESMHCSQKDLSCHNEDPACQINIL